MCAKGKKGAYGTAWPHPKWSVRKILVWESSNFEPELQTKYPDRAYAV
jgi:hypothetical protein